MIKYSGDPGYQAFRILQIPFIIAPIIAGLDKFFYLLVNWSIYIAPSVLRIIGDHDRGFMMFAGMLEIIAGIGVLFKPKIFAYFISLWLIGIIINLAMSGHYHDIILRDSGAFLASVALGKLSQKYG